jgi:hypothetical protein
MLHSGWGHLGTRPDREPSGRYQPGRVGCSPPPAEREKGRLTAKVARPYSP